LGRFVLRAPVKACGLIGLRSAATTLLRAAVWLRSVPMLLRAAGRLRSAAG